MARPRRNSWVARLERQQLVTLKFPDIFLNVKAFEDDILDGSRPIFSREMLTNAACNIEAARDPATCQQPVVIHSVVGKRAFQHNGSDKPVKKSLAFLNSYILAESGGKCAPYYMKEISVHDPSLLEEEILKPNDDEHPLRKRIAAAELPPGLSDDLQMMADLQAELYASQYWKELRRALDKPRPVISNIVCLALGNPISSLHTRRVEKRFDKDHCGQHIVACAIADYLMHGDHKVPILAFDPNYTEQDLHLLAKLPTPITVVSEPYQYLSITPETLVMCIHAPGFVPIYEIIADMLFPTGPAAFLSTIILERPWHKEGKYVHVDQRMPRVDRMLKSYDSEWLDAGWENGEEGVGEYLSWTKDTIWYVQK